MADYFPFYTSFKQAASTLPDDKRLQLYDIVTDYGNLGIEPPLEVDPVVMGMFSLIKPSIVVPRRIKEAVQAVAEEIRNRWFMKKKAVV